MNYRGDWKISMEHNENGKILATKDFWYEV